MDDYPQLVYLTKNKNAVSGFDVTNAPYDNDCVYIRADLNNAKLSEFGRKVLQLLVEYEASKNEV